MYACVCVCVCMYVNSGNTTRYISLEFFSTKHNLTVTVFTNKAEGARDAACSVRGTARRVCPPRATRNVMFLSEIPLEIFYEGLHSGMIEGKGCSSVYKS